MFERMKDPLLGADWFFNLTSKKVQQTKCLSILHSYTRNVIKSRRKLLEESKTTLENYENDFGELPKYFD